MPFKNDPFETFARIVATMVRKGKADLWREDSSIWVKLESGAPEVYIRFSPNDNGFPSKNGGYLAVFLGGAGISEGGTWLYASGKTLQASNLYDDVMADRIKDKTPNYPNIEQPSVKRLLALFEPGES